MPPDDKSAMPSKVEVVDEDQEGAGAPLIPESVMDAPLQRLFLLSLFALIQAWKVYYLILLRLSDNSNSNVNVPAVALFAIVDGAFLWLLPLFNLPYLTFSPLNTLLIMLVLNATTLLISSAQTFAAITAVFIPIYKAVFQSRVLTISGDSVKDSALANMDSHFKGKLTIHYLPDALALFNPFNYSGCLSDKSPPLIPIEFNTTAALGSLQLQHISPSNKVSYIDYSRKVLARIQKRDHTHLQKYPEFSRDPRISYVEVPVTEPGQYIISLVKDHKGVEIRTSRSSFQISVCPRAHFLPASGSLGFPAHVCLAAGVPLQIKSAPSMHVYGVPPLTALYATSNNGQRLSDVSISLGSAQNNATSVERLQPVIFNNVSLSRSLVQNSEHWPNLNPGSLEFHLLQISDSLGNVQRYNTRSRDSTVFNSIDLKETSSMSLSVIDGHVPLLIGGNKELKIECDAAENAYPLSVQVTHFDDKNNSETFSKLVQKPADLKFVAKLPGRYVLDSGSDKFCECLVVKLRNVVEVALAPLPAANITARAINDKCLGTIGYNFDLDCQGTPPFLVSYTVLRKDRGVLVPVPMENGNTKRLVRITSNKHAFKFSPLSGGDYAVVFDSVRDALYSDKPVPLDEQIHTYETIFTQVSLVSFFKSHSDPRRLRVCPGVPVSIPLYFDGNGPFTFEYEIVETLTGKRLTDPVTVSNVSLYLVEAPPLVLGKTFEVKLQNVLDKYSCAARIDTRGSIVVESRSETPTVGIKSSESVIVAEGDVVEIPLHYAGIESGHARLEYKYQSLDDPSDTQVFALSSGRQLRVQKAGRYSLVSFTDDGCPGLIANEDHIFTIEHYPRPTLEVSSDAVTEYDAESHMLQLLATCLYHQLPLRLSLEGEPPFIVDYEIELPSGVKETHSINVKLASVQVELPADIDGTHIHRFINVYDAHYAKLKSTNRAPLQSVRYVVNSLPDLEIEESQQVAQVCENQIKSANKLDVNIPVKLKGSFPFTIEATLTSEHTGVSDNIIFENVSSHALHLSRDGPIGLGEHVLTFDKIVDSNGCVQTNLSPFLNFVVIITKAPSIIRDGTQPDICVGDHVSYNLTGAPPFQIMYEFNGQARRATLGTTFRRLASVPGELHITGIEDSSHEKCAVDYQSPLHAQDSVGLHVTVHDLPSVEINHGKYIVRDIHQGEQTALSFTFEGVPPFSLTYVRTLDTPHVGGNGKRGKTKPVEVERHTITDIWEYQHTVPAELEGTYEAIEVRDAFCRAFKKQ